MNEGALIIALSLAGLGILVAAMLHFSKKRTEQELVSAKNRVQALEAELSGIARNSRSTKTKKQSGGKPQTPSKGNSPTELLSLRKETSHLKSQIQSLRTEMSATINDHEEKARRWSNERSQLQREKDELVDLLRQKETQEKSETSAQATSQSQEQKPQENSKRAEQELKKKLSGLERAFQSEKEMTEKLKKERQELQRELSRWTSAAQDADGKTLDPVLFRRWKQRALVGRQMYQMMRQLREMSDIKLTTYQEGLMRLSEHVLQLTGQPHPKVASGETKPDRYLAAALSAIPRHTQASTPSQEVPENRAEPIPEETESNIPQPSTTQAHGSGNPQTNSGNENAPS